MTKDGTKIDVSVTNQHEYMTAENITRKIYGDIMMLERVLHDIHFSDSKYMNFLHRIQLRGIQLSAMLKDYTDHNTVLEKQRITNRLNK